MEARVFATLSMLAYLACASPSPSARSSSAGNAEGLAGCPYLTFVTRSEGYPEFKYLVEADIVRDIEGIFADELEEWGWRRMDEPSSAAFVLAVAVGPSSLRTDMVQGVVLLRAGSTTHRDFLFASMDGVFPADASDWAHIGVIGIIEIVTHGDSVAPDFRSAVADYGQILAGGMEQDSLAKLCAWREQLVEDGLEVEEIRAELVREMVEVRKRARQRKELEIRAEDVR